MLKFLAIFVFLFGLFLAGCNHDSKSHSNNQSNASHVALFKNVLTQTGNYYDGNSYNISEALVVEKGYLSQGLAYAVVVCTDTSVKKWCIIIVNSNSINNLSRGDLINFNGKYYGYMDITVKDKNNKNIALRPPAFLVNGVSYIEHRYAINRTHDQSGNETKNSRSDFDDEYHSTIFTPNFLDITDWNNPFSPAFDMNPMKSISPYSGGGSLNGFDDDF